MMPRVAHFSGASPPPTNPFHRFLPSVLPSSHPFFLPSSPNATSKDKLPEIHHSSSQKTISEDKLSKTHHSSSQEAGFGDKMPETLLSFGARPCRGTLCWAKGSRESGGIIEARVSRGRYVGQNAPGDRTEGETLSYPDRIGVRYSVQKSAGGRGEGVSRSPCASGRGGCRVGCGTWRWCGGRRYSRAQTSLLPSVRR